MVALAAESKRRGRTATARDARFDAYRREPEQHVRVGLRNELVAAYLHVVRYHAERVRFRMPESVDVDDLIADGVFGLIDAIEAFDPDRNVKFETYCAPRVRGAMMDGLRDLDPVPRLARTRAKRLDASRERLTQRLDRPPSEHELAREMKLSPEDFRHVCATAAPEGQTEQSIDADLFENDDSGRYVRLIEKFVDERTPDPADACEMRVGFAAIVRSVRRVQRTILHLYYVEGLTNKEIGASLGLSESRISQLHCGALRTLRSAHCRR